MNCGRSSSVEWKLPKLQRRVRFPSPAPPPPGRVPGGFVMPASRPPSTECGGTIGAKLSPRKLGARRSGTKLAPHTPRDGIFGIKLAQHKPHATSSDTKLALLAQNGSIWHVLCTQGELYPATANNKPHTPPAPVYNSPCASRAAPLPVQNSPRTHHTPALAVQNSPSTPKMA